MHLHNAIINKPSPNYGSIKIHFVKQPIWNGPLTCTDGLINPFPKQALVLTSMHVTWIKGGNLGFSHLTELNNICITEIYMKKQYTNHQ